MTRPLVFCLLAAFSASLGVAPDAPAQAGSAIDAPVDGRSDAELQQIDPPADLDIPDAPVLTPEQALASFVVEEGFEVQLVAAEPLIEDPVCMAWDERGRLWVAEMKGYMPNLQGDGEDEPVGNIVILEDTDADGVMDKRTVWMDRIVLPRAIAFAKSGVLYADASTLYFVRLNSDGSAGAKMPIDRKYSDNGGSPGNVEHQANGLLYGLDNWYYSAKSTRRYQQLGGRFRRGETEFRGQWGITQDDDGRLLANRNPVLIEYDLYPPGATLRNPNQDFGRKPILRVDNSVYPARVTPGTNRAYRPDQDVSHTTWKLQRATAACGPVIYRGSQFPADYQHNVFVPEPAGHLVKRIVLGTDAQGKPTARQAYDNQEFLASTDERSRIVNAYTGPDGALYLVDMYRGVIQHKHYLSAYFKRQIKSRGLDTPIGLGRVYRVVHKGRPIDHRPVNLAEMDSAELVTLLAHPNAWHRHTAQRLLVQRRDSAAAQPLAQMATSHASAQARIHALWTLRGVRKLTPELLLLAGASEDPRVRVQVLRLAEDYAGEPEAGRFVALMQQYDAEQAGQDAPNWPLDLQLAFTGGTLAGIDTPQAYGVLLNVLARRDKPSPLSAAEKRLGAVGDAALFRNAVISGLRGKEAVMLAQAQGKAFRDALTRALVRATESGDLTIDSLLELVDAPDFADSRAELLENLAGQAVDQQRYEVLDRLIARLADPASSDTGRLAILKGMAQAKDQRGAPIELDGRPKVFDAWAAEPPAFLGELGAALDDVFLYERTIVSAELQARLDLGNLHYETHCAACHGKNGEGVPQAAPPLAGSEWVQMHPDALAALVLNGVEGDITVAGRLYTSPQDTPGLMPGLKASITSDEDLANILTFIRSRAFKNNQEHVGPVSVEAVAAVRQATASRAGMYSPAQLMAISNSAFAADGITPPVVADNAPKPKLLVPGWLDHAKRNLVLTLLAVTAPLVLLLLGTLLAANAKPIQPAH